MTKPDSRPAMRSRSRSEEFAEENFFSGCVTLDPTQTMDAWDRLSQDTFAAEFAHYPEFFHRALISTLKKRKNVFERG